IATPIHTHFEIAKTALEKGKHVLVEKPLAIEGVQCRELGSLAESRDLTLMTEYTYQFSPALNHAAQLIQDGRIGELKAVTITLKQLGRFLPYDILTLLGSHALSILAMVVPLDRQRYDVLPLIKNGELVTGALIRIQPSREGGVSGYIDVT